MELLYVVAGGDWCTYQLVFYFLCDGSFTLRVRVGCLIAPLETAGEALWKLLWKAGGRKKSKSRNIKRAIFDGLLCD
jgi:hypothetical protein